MNKEDYFKYYIQGSDHYLIPQDVFNELFDEMESWKEESKELNKKYLNAVADYETTMSELQKLKKQLEYLRSGEYYNQLRFENKMLQDIVDNGKVSKEDREFIDCTHRNTKLLEQQEEFINYMMNTIENITHDETDDEEIKGYLIQRIDTFKEILSKYKEIIGDDK